MMIINVGMRKELRIAPLRVGLAFRVLIGAYALASGAGRVLARLGGRLLCLCGLHRKPEYLGAIGIKEINRARHSIEYGNWLQCPRCGKKINLTYH